MSRSTSSAAAQQEEEKELVEDEDYRNELLVWERILDVRLADCRKCGWTAPEIAPPSLLEGFQPVNSLEELRTLLLHLVKQLRRSNDTAEERRHALNTLKSMLAHMDRCCAIANSCNNNATVEDTLQQQCTRNNDDSGTGEMANCATATTSKVAVSTERDNSQLLVLSSDESSNEEISVETPHESTTHHSETDNLQTRDADFRKYDVLSSKLPHAGNVFYQQLVQSYAAQFANISEGQYELARQINAQISERSGRFLEQPFGKNHNKSKQWVEMDAKKAERKTYHALRYHAKRLPHTFDSFENIEDKDSSGSMGKRKADDTFTSISAVDAVNNNRGQNVSNKKVQQQQQRQDNDLQATYVAKPDRHDVLAGVGKTSWHHPGNVSFRKYVQEHLKEWMHCDGDNANQKRRALERRVHSLVESKGGRFLERYEDGWVLLDAPRMIKKTQDCFRQIASKIQVDSGEPLEGWSPDQDADEEEEEEIKGNHEAHLETIHLDPSFDSDDDDGNKNASNCPILQLGSYDVLKHGGASRHVHQGNLTFKKLLQQYAKEFAKSGQKHEVVTKIMAEVTQLGGRFLERDHSDTYWVVRDPQRVMASVKEALNREAKQLKDTAEFVSDSIERLSPQLDKESDLVLPRHDDCAVQREIGKSIIATMPSPRNSTGSDVGMEIPAVPRKPMSSATTMDKPMLTHVKAGVSVPTTCTLPISQSEKPKPLKFELQNPDAVTLQSKVNEQDVLFPINRSWPGNTFLLEMLQHLGREYDVETQLLKIATSAFDRVNQKGGRFLKSLGELEWVELSRKEVIGDIRSYFHSLPSAATSVAVIRPSSSDISSKKDCTGMSSKTGRLNESPLIDHPSHHTVEQNVARVSTSNYQNSKGLPLDQSTLKSVQESSISFCDRAAISFKAKMPHTTCQQSDKELEETRRSEADGSRMDKHRDFTKESKSFMLWNGRDYCCILCNRVGIRDFHLASHCHKPEHIERLESAPFLHYLGRKFWECSLCKQINIHNEELASHCVKRYHLHTLHKKKHTRLMLQSDDDLAASKEINFDNWPKNVRDSAPFLDRYRNESTGKCFRRQFQCSLCCCYGIQDIHLLSHCMTREHAQLLANSIKEKPESHFSSCDEPLPQNAGLPPSPPLLLIDERSVKRWNHFATLTGDTQELHCPVFLTALPDQHPTYACTQDERPAVQLSFLASKMLDINLAQQVNKRLAEWDPFWKTLSVVGMGVTSKIESASPETGLIRTAAVYNFTLPLPDEYGLIGNLHWGRSRDNSERTNGEVTLILRMLPVDNRMYQGKRADCHLWPKGTFLMLNGSKIQLKQRKQQAHDHAEWKYLCQDLDLTEYIRDPKQKNVFQFYCFDDQPYVFVFGVVQYRSVRQLKLYCDETITVLHQEAGFEKVIRFINQETMVTLDSDEEAGQDHTETRKLVYSLMCPISRTIIRTPVRGKNCKHFQCFDLENYLSANAFVSGNRWRCATCESFLSLKSLESCGLTFHLLHEFASTVSTDRDRIELSADRSYTLLKARQPRSKKRLQSEVTFASNAVMKEDNTTPPVKKLTTKTHQEVVDLCEGGDELLL